MRDFSGADHDALICSTWRPGAIALPGGVKGECANCSTALVISLEGQAFKRRQPALTFLCLPCARAAHPDAVPMAKPETINAALRSGYPTNAAFHLAMAQRPLRDFPDET